MPSRSRGPGRLPRGLKRVKTPRQDVGTPEGMLFQVNAQLKAKRKYLEKIKGDIAYLLRRKRKLEQELLYKEEEKKKGEANPNGSS